MRFRPDNSSKSNVDCTLLPLPAQNEQEELGGGSFSQNFSLITAGTQFFLSPSRPQPPVSTGCFIPVCSDSGGSQFSSLKIDEWTKRCRGL